MSKYSQYAQKLDGAFKEAAEKCRHAAIELKRAEENNRNAQGYFQERYIGEREGRRATAKHEYELAKHNMESVLHDAWGAFDTVAANLDRQLRAEVESAYTISPSSVDSAVVELLKAGIATPADMQRMAAEYSENPTMIKIIAQYAAKAAASAEDSAVAAQYRVVSQTVGNAKNAVLEGWDNLRSMANKCSGNSLGGRDVSTMDHAMRMYDCWEQQVASVIDNF